MSRYYHMSVEIRNYIVLMEDEIRDACANEWSGFEDFMDSSTPTGNYLQSDGREFMCGGETEEEFAHRLTQAIWKANGAFCDVTVQATCLEDMPCEEYNLDEDDYANFLATLTEEAEAVQSQPEDPDAECACGLRKTGCEYHKNG